ncbi:MAG: hypothetical protein WCT08_01300 [Patescibacteria group bacterium]
MRKKFKFFWVFSNVIMWLAILIGCDAMLTEGSIPLILACLVVIVACYFASPIFKKAYLGRFANSHDPIQRKST